MYSCNNYDRYMCIYIIYMCAGQLRTHIVHSTVDGAYNCLAKHVQWRPGAQRTAKYIDPRRERLGEEGAGEDATPRLLVSHRPPAWHIYLISAHQTYGTRSATCSAMCQAWRTSRSIELHNGADQLFIYCTSSKKTIVVLSKIILLQCKGCST